MPQKYFFGVVLSQSQYQMNASHWRKVNEKFMNTNILIASFRMKTWRKYLVYTKVIHMWPKPDNHFSFIIYVNCQNCLNAYSCAEPKSHFMTMLSSLVLNYFDFFEKILCTLYLLNNHNYSFIHRILTNGFEYDLLNTEALAPSKQIYNCDEFRWARSHQFISWNFSVNIEFYKKNKFHQFDTVSMMAVRLNTCNCKMIFTFLSNDTD